MRLLKLGLSLLALASVSLVAAPDQAPASPSFDSRPIAVKTPAPDYPVSLREEGVEGDVTVSFVIEKDGTVQSAKAIRSPDPRLSEIAESTVLKWTFRPGLKAGEPVAVKAQQTLTFSLEKKK